MDMKKDPAYLRMHVVVPRTLRNEFNRLTEQNDTSMRAVFMHAITNYLSRHGDEQTREILAEYRKASRRKNKGGQQ